MGTRIYDKTLNEIEVEIIQHKQESILDKMVPIKPAEMSPNPFTTQPADNLGGPYNNTNNNLELGNKDDSILEFKIETWHTTETGRLVISHLNSYNPVFDKKKNDRYIFNDHLTIKDMVESFNTQHHPHRVNSNYIVQALKSLNIHKGKLRPSEQNKYKDSEVNQNLNGPPKIVDDITKLMSNDLYRIKGFILSHNPTSAGLMSVPRGVTIETMVEKFNSLPLSVSLRVKVTPKVFEHVMGGMNVKLNVKSHS